MKYKEKEQSRFKKGKEEVKNLGGDIDRKAGLIHTAYEAAVAELGYTQDDLMDSGNSKEVVKLMFSDKYLGSKEFNKYISEDHAGKSHTDQQRDFKGKLGMTTNDCLSVIAKYGNLQRGALERGVDQHYSRELGESMTSWIWHQAYDPKADLEQNMRNYAELLKEDPVLTNADINPMKFDSVEDITGEVFNALQGNSTVKRYEKARGAEFH